MRVRQARIADGFQHGRLYVVAELKLSERAFTRDAQWFVPHLSLHLNHHQWGGQEEKRTSLGLKQCESFLDPPAPMKQTGLKCASLTTDSSEN